MYDFTATTILSSVLQLLEEQAKDENFHIISRAFIIDIAVFAYEACICHARRTNSILGELKKSELNN